MFGRTPKGHTNKPESAVRGTSMPCPFSCPIAFLFRTSHKPSFASYQVKVNEMRGHRSPVTDEEELHLSANLSNSSPSNSQPFPKTPKPSANLAASLLSNSGMKPP